MIINNNINLKLENCQKQVYKLDFMIKSWKKMIKEGNR
jgi:hypothetical protein